MPSRTVRSVLFALVCVAACSDESTVTVRPKLVDAAPPTFPAQAPEVEARTPPPAPRDPLPLAPPSTATPEEPATDAIAALEAQIVSSPDDARLHVDLARLLLSSSQVKKARKHAERATDLDPKSSAAWNTLGRVELLDRDVDAAIDDFQTATGCNATNTYAWNNLGLALGLAERWEESAQALEKAVALDDAEAFMWNNLGTAYEQLDRLEDARDAYRVAAKAGSPSAKANLSRLDAEAMPDDMPAADDDAGVAP